MINNNFHIYSYGNIIYILIDSKILDDYTTYVKNYFRKQKAVLVGK